MGDLVQLDDYRPDVSMWSHYCRAERTEIAVGAGEACNWCGLIESECAQRDVRLPVKFRPGDVS